MFEVINIYLPNIYGIKVVNMYHIWIFLLTYVVGKGFKLFFGSI